MVGKDYNMHDLIKDNQIIKSNDFNSQTLPILHANKGKWVPRATINPDIDSAKQTKTLTKTVNEDSTVWEYVVSDIPAATLLGRALEALDVEKKTRLDAGFDVEGTWFDYDINARVAYRELASELIIDPTYTTPWKASPNAWVTMDAALFETVRLAGKVHIAGVFAWLASEQSKL